MSQQQEELALVPLRRTSSDPVDDARDRIKSAMSCAPARPRTQPESDIFTSRNSSESGSAEALVGKSAPIILYILLGANNPSIPSINELTVTSLALRI